ncbi:type II toxin-antitoxin system toxin TscT [Staphylococcus hominis]|uniref:type II toxin-antitoxin system toxin TscT n=1 Tax=Staphylococcus hominis TaxID=1290 RepID=UPI000C7D9980|nr:DUF1474 family protein [Staphylococcus hominis]MCI2895983.1 DUF1474 family protein [Staphylococcus hominis]MCI2904493.1 DUF1474 family protein [Staphylococcus hominis]MCI2906599.1 DUF1474 family protein [Staphylococcus hominis]MCI2913017.1 DUF1474 family protein [Staphylococcus hominis]MCT1471193.1 DUF1474 family protein [Staphylococcus hominis]
MNFEQSNILCDLKILKEKLEDLYTTHAWHFDDVYIKREIQTEEETSRYLMGYSENRIQHTQHSDLLHMYLKEFDSLLKRFKELDKKETLSESDQTTDNAQLNK